MKALLRIGLPCLFFLQLNMISFAQSGIITTYVGPNLPVNGAMATTQTIDFPSSVAPDGAGGFYVASAFQNTVYRVTADGRLSVAAGNGTYGYSGDGGPAASAQLAQPSSIAVDTAGNLFIAEAGGNQLRVRKVTPGGVIYTVVEETIAGLPASLQPYPWGIAVDTAGNLFLADSLTSLVRMVTPNGVISTVAGNGTSGFSGDGGPATSAELCGPYNVAVDTAGNLFIADVGNLRIRKVTPGGVISTVAGNGTQGFSGDGGPATSAQFYRPFGVAVDTVGNLFIADPYTGRIRKVTPDGVISTVAGNGTDGFGGDGGQAISASLAMPSSVTVDTAGNLFIADQYNERIRKVTPGGVISTVAGNGTYGFSGDGGPGTSAQLDSPAGVAMDVAGNQYIADGGNYRIRKVTSGGVISTVAGNGTQGFSGDGGQATSAQINNGSGGEAEDTAGNLFIADDGNNRIRKVTPGGVISTVAGNGTPGFSGDGGPATSAQLAGPWGVAVDMAGNLFIAERYNNCIRKVTPGGVISTVAGNGTQGFSGDGGPATSAQLFYPVGIAVDTAGNLFIADEYNYRIRKVTPVGVISTVAGNGSMGYSGDDVPATSAELDQPTGVAVDTAGNLFIADQYNNRVRKVTPNGVISTVAGNGIQGFSGDGGPATSAQLYAPWSVAVDTAGNLFIADRYNSRIRKVTPAFSFDAFFPQVVVGGGSSTLFTITNTGSTAASGNLILTDQQANPFTVSGVLTDSFGTTQSASVGSSFSLYVPAGGTVFLSANPLNPGNPLSSGWADLESNGGSLTGVATYEYVSGGIMQYMVGVLQSPLLQFATIPVDNDNTQDKQMAYAIANPSSQTISVKLALVGQDGTVVDDTLTVTLGPGQQIAKYLWQDLPASANFKGSLVLRGQAGASVIAVALLQKQGLFTVIPVIPGKTPGVPN